MPDFNMNTQSIEEALERMTSMEPYHCNPFNNPPQLKKKAGELQKELTTLTELDGDRRIEILKELFGTYHQLAFPGDGFHCDYGFNIHFHGLAVINYNVIMLCVFILKSGIMLILIINYFGDTPKLIFFNYTLNNAYIICNI